jgi:two-component system, chemotaxis family, CheB/CheR fusion protein
MNEESPAESAVQTSPTRAGRSFPIAGIGISAGGLAPAMQLVQRLGPNPGIGVVLISHLDPTHESSLVEILSKASTIHVQTARDGELIQPNNIYVMAPNTELGIADGALRVMPRGEGPGPHMPIDQFFRALAQDQGRKAVGVILSGTGSDGSVGVQAIKAEQGTTFAQDDTAEHGDMPRNAIAAGAIDVVGTPASIATELAGIVTRPRLDHMHQDASDDEPVRRILLAVRQATGSDFSQYKRTTLMRRIQRRAFLHRLATLGEYADFVTKSASEAEALSEEVLIHVTSFFRDPAMFEALDTVVFPKLLADRRHDEPIRVWVPGCSTGEEVYSLAIALLEFLEKSGTRDVTIRVFGTDISNRAIERARAGRYLANIAQEVSPVRLQRFFAQADGAYQLVKEVRDQCVFATQNVARDPPFSNLDLISCRNLMIYLDQALQQRVMPLFHYGLRTPGFLVLGSAEGVGSFSGFALVDAKHRIFQRVPNGERTLVDFGSRGPASSIYVGARPADRSPRQGEVHGGADEAILAAVAPDGVVVNEDLTIIEFRGRLSTFFEPTPGVASLDLMRVVREEYRLDLRRAIDEARSSGKAVRREGRTVGDGDTRGIQLNVIPFSGPAARGRFFAILFENVPPEGAQVDGDPKTTRQASAEAELRLELTSTRGYLQSVVERLEASNEELRALSEETISSNEELHSTNEELQTAKEELQATNEELRTINDEMIERNATTTRLADDLANVLESVSIPIVILGRDSRIRRFTPSAAPLMSLIGADVGRPIADIKPKIQVPELPKMIDEALTGLAAVAATVQGEGEDGRWYRLTVRPYVTSDHRVDGTVISVFDVDALKRTELLLTAARDYAEGIVETVREGLVVLDGDLRVQSANPAFYETFKLAPADVEKQPFFELDGGVWDVPEVRDVIVRAEHAEERVERDFPRLGSRIFLVTARRIARTPWLLVALDDVTESARADAVRRSEDGFRRMLTAAADGIVMTNASGRIVFANEAIAKMLGYSSDEMLGMSADHLLPEPTSESQARPRVGYDPGPVAQSGGRGVDRTARHRDGREVPVEVVLSVMDATEGRLVVKFVTDVTERREAERKILEYQEKLQRMAFDATVAEEQERRRIAVDLHDRIGQALAAARMKMMSAQERTGGEAKVAIEQALDLVARTIADTRTLLFDLSPPVLYDLGFREALSWLAEEVETRDGLHVEVVEHAPQPSLDETTAAILFRSVRELLINVVKHSDVRHVRVSLRRDGDTYEVEVTDGGRGFDVEAVTRSGGSGFGLFSVREQMSRLRGTLDVSSAPTQGTRVTLRVPGGAVATGESSKVGTP